MILCCPRQITSENLIFLVRHLQSINMKVKNNQNDKNLTRTVNKCIRIYVKMLTSKWIS